MWKKCKLCTSYLVSTNGEVKHTNSKKILKPRKNKQGYLYVDLSLGHRKLVKSVLVHRLIAETFIPNPDNKPQVNHKDGNKQNNCVNNLEWVTNQENINHSIITGLKPNDYGELSPNSKLTMTQVEYCRKMYIPGDKKYGCTALAKYFSITKSTMSYILNCKTYIPR